LAGQPYSASSGDTASGTDSNSASLGHYAEIITSDNRLLANASAIAYQNAGLYGQSFNASGLVSADTVLKNGAASSMSKAEGSSSFTASYNLQKATPFSLSLDLGVLQDVDLAFSAIDNRTGEKLWDFAPSQSGQLQHIDWSGILDAGDYTFSLNAMADSLVNQKGVQDAAGQAIYSVSLDFLAESSWVAVGELPYMFADGRTWGLVNHETLTGLPSDGCFIVAGDVPANASVPEPGVLALLLAGLLSYGLYRRVGVLSN
jgi:hypothetical protein